MLSISPPPAHPARVLICSPAWKHRRCSGPVPPSRTPRYTPPEPAGAASIPCTMPARGRRGKLGVGWHRRRHGSACRQQQVRSRNPNRHSLQPKALRQLRLAPVTPATIPQSTTSVWPCMHQRDGWALHGKRRRRGGPPTRPWWLSRAYTHVDAAAHVGGEVEEGGRDVLWHDGPAPQGAHLGQRRLHICDAAAAAADRRSRAASLDVV